MADEPETNDELLLTDTVEQEAPEVEDTSNEPEGDEEEEIFAFGDEPTEPQETDTGLVKHLREELKKARKEAAESRKPVKEADPSEESTPPPTIEDCELDWDIYNERMLEWARKEARVEAKKSRSSETESAQIEATRQRIEKEKQALGKLDADDAFETVSDTLSPVQQSLLVHTVEDGQTAKFIYALAKNPERLAALAAIDAGTNAARFIKEVTKLEGKLQMVKRRPPINPDTPISGSAKISNTPGGEQKKLAELEKKADETGDRTELFAYRRKLRAAGKL